jgi:lipid-binding SYLF domain-containing protein
MRTGAGLGPRVGFALAALGVAATTARAQGPEWSRVAAATMVLNDIAIRNQKDLPPLVLRRAYAVGIFPEVIKAGFVFGGRIGHGVILIRGAEGWSNPAFASIGGASFGAQVGVQSTDLVLVFKNRGSLEGFLRNKGKATLGVNGSAAIGAIGRHAEADAGIGFQSEILALSRNRGLFAGASIAGSAITFDARANARFYGQPITPNEIFTNCCLAAPEPAMALRQMLTARSGITAQPKAPRGEVAGTPAAVVRGVESDTGGVIVESGPSRLDSILDSQWGVPGDPPSRAPAPAPASRSGSADPAEVDAEPGFPLESRTPAGSAPLNAEDLPPTQIERGPAPAPRSAAPDTPPAPASAASEPGLDLDALPPLEAPASPASPAAVPVAPKADDDARGNPAAGDQPSFTRPSAAADMAPTRVRATSAWRPVAPAPAPATATASAAVGAVAASPPRPQAMPSGPWLDPLPMSTVPLVEVNSRGMSGWRRLTPLPTVAAAVPPSNALKDAQAKPAGASAAALAPTETVRK